MPTYDDIKADKFVKALVFGKYKSGKTAGALTFPRVVVMDLDSGIATAINPELATKYKYRERLVEYEQFTEKNLIKGGIPGNHNAYDDACKYFDRLTAKDRIDTWDTLVVDTLTSLSEFARNKGVVLLGSKDFGGKPLSFTHDQAKRTGLLIPKMQDYGAERSLVEQFVDMVLGLDKHVLVLAHEKDMLNEDTGVLEAVVPLLTGQSVERVPLKFDEVWNLRTKKDGTGVKRYLQTQPDGVRRCGSRRGLPNETPFEWEAIKKALNI